MKAKILLFYSWFIRTFLFFFPDIPICMQFRGWLYGLFMKSCGKNFQVTHDSIIRDLQQIEVGSHCFVGNGSVIMGGGTIKIEDYVIIGPHAVIISDNHTIKNGSFKSGPISCGTIILKRGSWVAANSTMCINSVLPERSVLGANSMMNKEFIECESIYGGVPARFIKRME